jgi:hypothetical protein
MTCPRGIARGRARGGSIRIIRPAVIAVNSRGRARTGDATMKTLADPAERAAACLPGAAPAHAAGGTMAKYGRKASRKVERVMREKKRGTLKSGSGRKVTSRKQAIAIGLSEARKAGDKVPSRKSSKRSSSKSKSKTSRSSRTSRKK